MKPDILYLDKTPYENGKISWEYFRQRVKIDTTEIEKILSDNDTKKKVETQFNNLKQQYPKYYDEVIGKADWLWIDRLTYFSILCPEITDIDFEHCTTIMCKKDNGHFIISHNEDDDWVDGNFCICKVKINDNNWFVTNDAYNMPFWNGMSWNSYGIVKTVNYCHDEDINLDNLPRYFSQRHLTEAKSIDEMIARCEEMKVASGFHINAIDINNNIAVSIEAYSNWIDVEYIDDYYAHSNHYIHKDRINNPKTDVDSNSVFRLNKCNELFWDRTLQGIKKVLSYRSKENKFENSILQTKEDPYITLYNFSFDIDNKNTIYLNTYLDNDMVELNYDL